jgi:ATP-dependent helicase/nuclease subunit A
MSETPVIAMPLPDAEARGRIKADLDTNLLVEAGAGSGKTTELVERMVALVATGCARVDEIAAVTFTRKAAGELRERFQTRLERRLAHATSEGDGTTLPLLRRALDDIDRGFIGTIHAFCARLLRERPLDVGLDPAFEELPVEERLAFRRHFWESYLERATREGAETLEALSEAGVRPGQLWGLFDRLVENPDVDFPAPEAEPPTPAELGPVRGELDDIVSKGLELMDAREPDKGWDSLQTKLRTLAFTRDVTGWAEPADFFHALSSICKSGKGHRITKNRWKDGDMARALCDRVDAFGVGDTPARSLVKRWYAHRYALAIRFVAKAAEDFAEHRRRSGRLDFQDLLLLTARLLRSDPRARADLGVRYRRLLVDEFQDTDPLQAEVMLLLASDPAEDPSPPHDPADQAKGAPDQGATEPDPADWRRVAPRPGALFVVGDPKQSIYRFRRADIQLYDLVKRRFQDFGAVLELTMNFRSRPPIGDLVNQRFDDPAFFPPEASAEQAGFEPLNTRPAETSAPAEGVFWYEVAPRSGTSRGAVTADDASRLATWIAERVASGERQPGDFMILTRTTHYLATYARALEAHGIPVQVSGAGVGAEREIRELATLLACMIDPTHPVKVVAVLVGLFFGLDHERLLAHRLAGGSFDVVRPGRRGDPEVLEALGALHGWWRSASREPADVFVGRMVSELGLLPLAAAGELGSIRAGALRYALDAVRATALAGDASLPGAVNAMQAALDLREAEAPLEPSLPNVVRLMNLHQAKGLESPVVVLADPSRQTSHTPDAHVERGADGTAVGYLCVKEARGGFSTAPPLAQPEAWDAKAEAEARFEAAEAVRLLYVAVTRARDELVVARWVAKPEGSAWGALDPWLEAHATRLELTAAEPTPPEPVDLGPEDAAAAVEAAAHRLSAMGEPSFRHASVTALAKREEPSPTSTPASGDGTAPGRGFRGYSWGSAVHGALAAAAENPPDGALLATCRVLLVEQGRPLDDHGEPVELAELIALVRAVRASELWRRAQAAPRMLAEVPFAATGVDAGLQEASSADPEGRKATAVRRQLELFQGGGVEEEEEEAAPEPSPPGPTEILEGVIDLAFQEDGGWVIADYKTDLGTDPDFPARVQAYRRQVELYARAWAHLTGDPVKERVLLFTSQGRMESW